MKRLMCKLTLTLALTLTPTLTYAQVQLGLGVQEFIFNANGTAAPITGTVYSIPSNANQLTWNISFASAPASQTTVLETSNDNSTWVTADVSISTTGESRNVFTAARFVRATESARSGGGAITLTVVAKSGPVATVVSTATFTAPTTLDVPSIGVTTTDDLILTNSTLATGGVQLQMSPRLRWRGNAWSGAVSETIDWFAENLPRAAATNTSFLQFGYSRAGAAALYPFVFDSPGQFRISGAQSSATTYPGVYLHNTGPTGSVVSTFAQASGAGNLITGSVAGDLSIRNVQKIILSADGGTTANFSLLANGQVTQSAVAFASLGTPANGTFVYCNDCAPTTPASCPATKASCICAGAGVGSWAFRANALWYCPF